VADRCPCRCAARLHTASRRTMASRMDLLRADDYWLARLAFQRALALIYLVAFLVTLHQFRPLLGERGMLPTPQFLAAVRFREAPSIFHFGYTYRRLATVSWIRIFVSLALVLGAGDLAPTPIAVLGCALLWTPC